MKTTIKWMGILALVVLAAVSCEVGGLEPELPEGPVGKIHVKMGANIESTKSTVVTSGSDRTLNFTEGDRLYVRGLITGTDPQKIVAGYLSLKDDPGTTTASFEGDLSVYEFKSAGTPDVYEASEYDFGETAPLTQCSNILGTLVHKDAVGFTVDASQAGSYATAVAGQVDDLMTKCLPVYGYYDNGSIPMSVGDADDSCHPIFNCNLSGLSPDAEYTLVYRNGDDIASIDVTKTLGTITADNSGSVAFACYVSGTTTANEYHGFLLTNTADAADVKITSLGTKALTSKVYNVTRAAYPQTADLNTMYSTDANNVKYYAARDGQTLTGNFGGYGGYITIADGATVTLNIGNFDAPHKSDHAPIHCLGDANIILASGMNAYARAGTSSNYPAVFVPEGKTLTISGTGELKAYANNSRAAGIGGGQNITGGNIVIAGGVISAYGSNDCAAIGSSSNSNCGNITISGGVIKEAKSLQSGNHYGAGIGSGASGSCGTITISGGQIGGDIGGYTYEGAIAGQDAASIGSGRGGSCGTITIGTGITFVMAYGGNSNNNLIGSKSNTRCDVYFGDLKVYDKTAKKWYNSSTGAYDASSLVHNNTYGGLKFENNGRYWCLTPVTP